MLSHSRTESVARSVRDSIRRRIGGQQLNKVEKIMDSNILDPFMRDGSNDEMILGQVLACKVAWKVRVWIRWAPAARVPEIAQWAARAGAEVNRQRGSSWR